MTTGQSVFSIIALVLLSTILTNFYEITGQVGGDISSGQDGILLTSLATSYMEIAQGFAFDEVTDTMHVTGATLSVLTSPISLGRETGEDSLQVFDDIDDFKGYVQDREVGNTNRRYRTQFNVVYVDPANLQSVATVRTFCKRLDMKMWRIAPMGGGTIDTLRMSYVMGYYHFD